MWQGKYFVNIFQQQHSDFSYVIDVINPSVSENDNDMLMAPFTKAEFKNAIFSMHPDKCSGPYGYSPGFSNTFGIYVAMIFLKNVVVG